MHRLDAHLARLSRSAPRATAVVLVNDETASETTTRLTWTELDGVVDALAARLRASWRTSNDDDDDDDDAPARVVSLCRDGVAAVVALLASSRARRSVVPLDAEAWPRARIREAARVVGCLGRDDDDDARTTPTVLCATREEIPRAMEIFGARADVVLFASVLKKGLPGDTRTDVLRRVRAALAPGGLVFVFADCDGDLRERAAAAGLALRLARHHGDCVFVDDG